MTWLQRFRLGHYCRNSIWILPLFGMIAALGVVRCTRALDEALDWKSDLDPDTTRAVLGTMAASMFTFVVFVSSALLLAVQLASAQLTPRIIAFVFRDLVTKLSLTVFVFTFTFSLGALVTIKTSVPLLTSHLAAYSCLVALAIFLWLLDHVCQFLRPSGSLRVIGLLGRRVIERVYPRRFTASPSAAPEPTDILAEKPSRTIENPRAGVVLAFDHAGLLSLAQSADCVIELVPQVGDFVAADDPLFRIYQGGASLPERRLHQSVAVGPERTPEQDPTYAFRIIVDIANKGLSPAINDPTTAVLAVDQVHHLLRNVGSRDLDEGRVCDGAGRLRLVYRTPDWEDFVYLAVTEIRQYGGESIQIVRRLRAMLENLIQTLPEERTALLRQELLVLQKAAERFFPEPEDRALADVSDFQGVGGKYDQRRPRRSAPESPGPALRLAPSREKPMMNPASTTTSDALNLVNISDEQKVFEVSASNEPLPPRAEPSIPGSA
jgi:uncharacterized membrane protein